MGSSTWQRKEGLFWGLKITIVFPGISSVIPRMGEPGSLPGHPSTQITSASTFSRMYRSSPSWVTRSTLRLKSVSRYSARPIKFKKRCIPCRKLHKHINIAFTRLLLECKRPEDADPLNAVPHAKNRNYCGKFFYDRIFAGSRWGKFGQTNRLQLVRLWKILLQ